MPFEPAEPTPDLRPDETALPAFAPPPDYAAVPGAAFRQENSVVSLIQYLRNSHTFPDDPSYNPMDTIRGTKYAERYSNRFLGVRSLAEAQAEMSSIDAEEHDKGVLDSAGGFGTIMGMIGGTVDPTMLIPGLDFARAGKVGLSTGRLALEGASSFAIQQATQEAILQGTQQSRSLGGSVAAVGSATILGALLGPAASLLSREEFKGLTQKLEHDRATIDAHAAGETEPAPPITPEAAPSGTTTPISAGAAASDTRKLELISSGLDKVPGVKHLMKRIDPMSRVLNSESVTARRTAVDLSETPLLFKENLEGIPTSSGPSLERLARMEITQSHIAVGDQIDRLYSDYRFGAPDTSFPRLRAQAERFMGRDQGKLTVDEFKHEMAVAMRNNDQHDIPQVAQAAQFIRQRVYNPWKERALKAGIFPEDMDVKTADSYFTRLYNKELIAARRPDFVEKTTSWLESDQATKALAQQRVEGLQSELSAAIERIDKAERKLADLGGREREISGRQRETDLVEDAGNRPAILAEREQKALERRRELNDEIAEAQRLHDETRKKIEEEIAAWEGKSVNEAKAALKARTKAESEGAGVNGRLSGADAAIDRAVKRILKSDRNLSRQELQARAEEITDRILSSADGRLPYDIATGGPQIGIHQGEPPRGSLAAREFMIPDALIADYLENDVEHVVTTHLRTMVPDVMLTERFGDVRMTEAFKKINEEYSARVREAKDEKARTRLEKQRQSVIESLAAMRDRIRSTYGIPSTGPMKSAARVVGAIKNYNVLTSMGVAALSSLPDMAGSIFRHGFQSTFSHAWLPWFKFLTRNSDAYKQAKTQFRAMGISVETTLSQRHRALNDILDVYKPQTKLERTLQWGSDKFQTINLLAQWTDWGKTTASMVASAEILKAAEHAIGGVATKKQITTLAESGIDLPMAKRIADQFKTGGEIRDGVRLPNTADWTDIEARRAFEGAVSRDADIAIVTPGQEKPLWLSTPVVSVLGQFKSFTAAATQRVLVANLQRRDAQVLQGLIFSMGLGMMSYWLNSVTGGQPVSDKPQDWIKEAMSRGNLFGWFEEGNAMSSKLSGGKLDLYRTIGAGKPSSRYAGRTAMDQFLGPTAGKAASFISVTGAAGRADWNASDSKALRRLFALQNVVYVRRLFDQVEASGNSYFGVQAKPPKPH